MRFGAITAAAIAVSLACAAGCSTVRRARAFQDPASARPGERTPTIAELGLKPDGPVSLDELLRKALEVNPSVVQARRTVEITAARVRETEADFYPQASTNASVGYRDSKNQPGVPENHHSNSFGFDVSWLLFDFGRTRALARNLGELWLAAQSDLKTAELTVAFNVRSAYINLSRQIALLRVADETVLQFAAHLEQVHEFVQVGTRIPYDETKAQVDLGNARLTQVKTRDAVLAAQASLANAIGLAEVVDWTPDADAPLPAVPDDFEAAWKIAREKQPTLASARAREQAASFLVDARIGSLYPSLGLNFAYSASGSTFPLSWGWILGPALQWIPFDGNQRVATIDESVAALRLARASRALAEQQAWLDVRGAWLAIQDARQRIELTTLTVQNAEQNLEHAKALFAVGKGTSVDLADAEQALAQAKSDQVQSQADEHEAMAQLARAIGIALAQP